MHWDPVEEYGIDHWSSTAHSFLGSQVELDPMPAGHQARVGFLIKLTLKPMIDSI